LNGDRPESIEIELGELLADEQLALEGRSLVVDDFLL